MNWALQVCYSEFVEFLSHYLWPCLWINLKPVSDNMFFSYRNSPDLMTWLYQKTDMRYSWVRLGLIDFGNSKRTKSILRRYFIKLDSWGYLFLIFTKNRGKRIILIVYRPRRGL